MMPHRPRDWRALNGRLFLALTLAGSLLLSASPKVQAQDFLTNTLDKIFKPQSQQPAQPDWQANPEPGGPAGQPAPVQPIPGHAPPQQGDAFSPGFLGMGGGTAPEQAQAPGYAAPLPSPNPLARSGAPAPAQTATAPSAPVQDSGPTEDGRATLTTVQRINDYYNSVQSMTGTFTQVDPDGTRRTGDFYMQKPGRVRFQYDAPSPMELISNGQSVAVRDRNLNTQDITPLSQTPLRFLLAKHVDLLRDPHVVDIVQDERYVTIVMEQKVPMMGTYRLLLMFDPKSGALKQWIVTDPQGYNTQVILTAFKPNTNPDPRLFVINFQRFLR
ncbi:outer-membrane lipoprotein carrier protein LolA [Xanthobacter sp. TB0139]|uniref:outer-membrane lipoprotein carrier protein LolA n=1 Tax=Xanthobacter sp. TB0139 TaxID=3459178 RepID=UPI004039DBFE